MSLMSRIEKLENIDSDQKPRIVWVETGLPRSPELMGDNAGRVIYVRWQGDAD